MVKGKSPFRSKLLFFTGLILIVFMLLIQLFSSTGRLNLFSKADWNPRVGCNDLECNQLLANIQNRFRNNDNPGITEALKSCLTRNLGGQRVQEAINSLSQGQTLNLSTNDLKIIESCKINPQYVHATRSGPTVTPTLSPTPISAQRGSNDCPTGYSRRLCYIATSKACLQDNLCVRNGLKCSDYIITSRTNSERSYSDGTCPSFQCPQGMNRLYCHYIQKTVNTCDNSTLCVPSGHTCSGSSTDFGFPPSWLEDNNCDGSTGLNWLNK